MSLYRETRKCEQDRLKDVHVEVHGKRAGCYKMLKTGNLKHFLTENFSKQRFLFLLQPSNQSERSVQ